MGPVVQQREQAAEDGGIVQGLVRIERPIEGLGHEVGLETGEQLPSSLVGVAESPVTVVGQLDRYVDHGAGRAGQIRCASLVRFSVNCRDRMKQTGRSVARRAVGDCLVICKRSLPSSVDTISAWWSEMNPRSFSIVTGSGTAVTSVSVNRWLDGEGCNQRRRSLPPFALQFVRNTGAQLHDAIATTFLGTQQGAIGTPQHGLRCIAGLDFRHAEAGGDRAVIEAALRGILQLASNLLGPLRDRGIVAVGAEHHEFLAAVASDQVAGTCGTLQQ